MVPVCRLTVLLPQECMDRQDRLANIPLRTIKLYIAQKSPHLVTPHQRRLLLQGTGQSAVISQGQRYTASVYHTRKEQVVNLPLGVAQAATTSASQPPTCVTLPNE